MDRVILHSDINACYASIELLYRPELRGRPMAVAGDPESRHGIVLAKEELAKRAGVKTGMALWQARQVCPEVVFVPPRMDLYVDVTRQVRCIYSRYTDRQESFGIDESWLDLTGCAAHRDGALAADELRQRIKKEIGLTVSVGVSWNKVFAKFGSDYKKPDAVTVIDRSNFREVVWPLPVSELLFVGRATARRLSSVGITTIGELAKTSPELLHSWLGKNGYTLYSYANGLDRSPVRRTGTEEPIKSIGHSTTAPRDLKTTEDFKTELMALCERTAMRLRNENMHARVIEVSIRDAAALSWSSRQTTLERPTDVTVEIFSAAKRLCLELWGGAPARGVGVRVSGLSSRDEPEQLSLFSDDAGRDVQRKLDAVTDAIRGRFGFDSITRGLSMAEPSLRGNHTGSKSVSVFGIKAG